MKPNTSDKKDGFPWKYAAGVMQRFRNGVVAVVAYYYQGSDACRATKYFENSHEVSDASFCGRQCFVQAKLEDKQHIAYGQVEYKIVIHRANLLVVGEYEAYQEISSKAHDADSIRCIFLFPRACFFQRF